MTEAEEESDRHWPLTERDKSSEDVVDGADVVGIEAVAEAERPGQQAERKHRCLIGLWPQEDGQGDDPREGVGQLGEGYKSRARQERTDEFHNDEG